MTLRQSMGWPLIFGIALILLLVYFLKTDPVKANAAFAGQTGQSCATCHYTNAAPSAANLTSTGQEFLRCGYILNCGPSNLSPGVSAAQQPNYQGSTGNFAGAATGAGFQPGKVWIVQMREANGRFADMIWTKRGNSNSFDVMWHLEGNRFADVMNYEGYRNGQISFYSAALNTRFTGTPSPNGNYIYNGRLVGGDSGPNDSWTASIF
jgi:hypothetical protein